ncbi:PEGA domain-containing protein [Limnoglobus roseus]|uniref:PEGA domain-containing protein n=1 Tax=Limnoglobus roseus TaxID=2598579 RepID=A0A5C1ALV8_9BACT|nr:PEGA domain-containing protein [Limnoglobus roseus]QEL17898.1 PEGA domain-containing protein [Limnoglobus roseus]
MMPWGRKSAIVLSVVTLLAAGGGCVERRFVVQTNAPGAQVYVNNQAAGPSPADVRWDYTGVYEFRAVAQGYEPLVERIKIRPKWYEYPGLDFFFEAVYPFHIEDVRRISLELRPAELVRTDELLDAAERLREQGHNLPPPKYPEAEQPKRDPLLPR